MLGLVPLHLTLYTIHQNAAQPPKKNINNKIIKEYEKYVFSNF